MAFLPGLEELDRDGAIQETAAKVDPDTRAAFLKKLGVGVGAIAAGGAFAGALPGVARGAVPQSDVDILNFALTLEYLEGEFYALAVKNGVGGRTVVNRFARVVAQHEKAHVDFLKKVLGAKAVKKPQFNFKDTVTDLEKFKATADVLENTGVHAYLGQVGNIKTKAVLVGAGRILSVEARHAAWIRQIRFPDAGAKGGGSPQTPAPGAFEDGFSKKRILDIVKSTGFIVG
jgi:hypothetical protein